MSGILAELFRVPSIVSILWHPSLYAWVKVNTDGLVEGNLDSATCGGGFRNFAGYFCGDFSQSLEAFYFFLCGAS